MRFWTDKPDGSLKILIVYKSCSCTLHLKQEINPEKKRADRMESRNKHMTRVAGRSVKSK